ncbi:hypothetical protein DKG77_03785 [Flagellimonas aquimarina]|uniref:Uncharacterized protein n=1 Tax=Flagellimonas aquimarina TaxID=2201895 RepID=A0A316L4V4_9FLAO|nr:hypothetical protein [Allomuricauda koreensis]PWL39959.1 hypothetical protein DKG77_03785 [Allomuricauda koreensis]
MNKLLMIYGCLLIGSTAVAEEQQSTTMVTEAKIVGTFENSPAVLNISADIIREISKVSHQPIVNTATLNLDEIEFVEEDSEIDLGFDTSAYLPEGFNPYEIYFDFDSIIYFEDEDNLQIGFNTSSNLPEGFDSYTDIVGVDSINYIEDDVVELGFNTANYLPKGFSPYEVYFDLDSIEYIEDEQEEMDLGFRAICLTLYKKGINAD